MNTMSLGSQPPVRVRRARALGALVAIAFLLAGCSSSGSYDSGTSEYAPAGGEGDWAVDMADESWAMEEQALGEDGSASRSVSENRDVIVTGELYMTVEDPIGAARQATTIVQDAGGRIDARRETAADEYSGGSAWLTMRIPAAKLEAVVDELDKLGEVDDYNTSSLDVSTEVTDLEAQISTLRASTARIESLLDQASDISDIIKLESELDSRQARLESLEARQRGLDDQISMSTIELSLTTEPVVVVHEEPPSSFWDGLVSGWNGLVSFLTGTLVVLGMLLPWLAVAAIITGIVIVAVRASKRRRRAAAPAATSPAAASPSAPAATQPTSDSAS